MPARPAAPLTRLIGDAPLLARPAITAGRSAPLPPEVRCAPKLLRLLPPECCPSPDPRCSHACRPRAGRPSHSFGSQDEGSRGFPPLPLDPLPAMLGSRPIEGSSVSPSSYKGAHSRSSSCSCRALGRSAGLRCAR